MSICPHPCPSGPTGSPGHRRGAALGPVTVDSGQGKRMELGFRRGAVRSCSESSAVESGEGQMGNVGKVK